MFGLGFTLGPASGSFLGGIKLRLPFLLADGKAGFALGAMRTSSLLVRRFLLEHLLRLSSARILAVRGALAPTLSYLTFVAIAEGWWIFIAIIVGSVMVERRGRGGSRPGVQPIHRT